MIRRRNARAALLAATALVGWCAEGGSVQAQTISLSGRYTIRPEVVVDLSVLDQPAARPAAGRGVRSAASLPARHDAPQLASLPDDSRRETPRPARRPEALAHATRPAPAPREQVAARQDAPPGTTSGAVRHHGRPHAGAKAQTAPAPLARGPIDCHDTLAALPPQTQTPSTVATTQPPAVGAAPKAASPAPPPPLPAKSAAAPQPATPAPQPASVPAATLTAALPPATPTPTPRPIQTAGQTFDPPKPPKTTEASPPPPAGNSFDVAKLADSARPRQQQAYREKPPQLASLGTAPALTPPAPMATTAQETAQPAPTVMPPPAYVVSAPAGPGPIVGGRRRQAPPQPQDGGGQPAFKQPPIAAQPVFILAPKTGASTAPAAANTPSIGDPPPAPAAATVEQPQPAAPIAAEIRSVPVASPANNWPPLPAQKPDAPVVAKPAPVEATATVEPSKAVAPARGESPVVAAAAAPSAESWPPLPAQKPDLPIVAKPAAPEAIAAVEPSKTVAPAKSESPVLVAAAAAPHDTWPPLPAQKPDVPAAPAAAKAEIAAATTAPAPASPTGEVSKGVTETALAPIAVAKAEPTPIEAAKPAAALAKAPAQRPETVASSGTNVQLPVFGMVPQRPRPAPADAQADKQVATAAPPAPVNAAAMPAPAPPKPAPGDQTLTEQLAAKPLPSPGSPPSSGGPSLIASAAASPTLRAVAPAVAPPLGASAARLLFPPGSADLPSNVSTTLAGLAEKLRSNPGLHLAVVSSASNSSAEEDDARRISLNRAVAVRTYLIGQHVSVAQLDMKAQGDRFKDGGPLDRVDLILLER